ncbi:MAG: hypothetical protein R3292_11975 [Alcanivorax sp.]|nr:hypothetical protein [Alcanivorax sp.]
MVNKSAITEITNKEQDVINARMGIALTIHMALIAMIYIGPYPQPLAIFMTLFLALNLVGVLMIAAGSARAGSWLFLVGSIGFIPIGLVGATGARAMLDEMNRTQFDKGA